MGRPLKIPSQARAPRVRSARGLLIRFSSPRSSNPQHPAPHPRTATGDGGIFFLPGGLPSVIMPLQDDDHYYPGQA